MRFQFLRLYIFSAIILIGLVVSFGQLYNTFFYPASHHAISIPEQELRTLIMQSEKRQTLSLNDVALPDELKAQLKKHGSLTVSELDPSGNEQHFIYLTLPNQINELLQLGPLNLLTEDGTHDGVFIAFYSLLAVSLLLMFKPLFTDLSRLQRAAKEFGKVKTPIPLVTSKRSSIYPLAKSFSQMSHRITHFLQLHCDLSRILSHEIRTPLSRIRLALSLVDNIDDREQRELDQSLDEIEVRLEQYLSFARIENQFAVYALKPVAIDSIIEKTAERLAQYTDISVHFHFAVEQGKAESASLQVAVQNMLGNALKYASSRIDVSLTQDDKQLTLTVVDDGPGLPSNAKDLVQPFKRGTDPGLSSGYGLGLYIVQRIAYWHGGTIHIGNDPSTGGARISISWPGLLH